MASRAILSVIMALGLGCNTHDDAARQDASAVVPGEQDGAVEAGKPGDAGTSDIMDAGHTVRPDDAGNAPPGVCSATDPAGTLCDDFNGSTLDTSKWWYGRKHWGPPPPRNHGVAPENVTLHDGHAFFAANGDQYSGPVQGVQKNGDYVQDQPGTRSGGIIVSDTYLGSGRYEVRMKLPPKLGVCTALWTFHYEELYQGQPGYDDAVQQGNVPQGSDDGGHYVVVNHEIDIEIPTSLSGAPGPDVSYQNARYNTWIGEGASEYTASYVDNGKNLSDGQFHVFRFDWHTGGGSEAARVDFYVDDVLKHTNTTHIPSRKGRLTLGTWFPEWAGGDAPFDVQYLEVDWCKFTPFSEPNDREDAETYPLDGLTKCQNRAENDAKETQCMLGT